MKFLKILLPALFFTLPLTSMAWGLLGHRIVGEIAFSYLTPKAKKEIQLILGNESLAMSTNWADFIKSDPSYRYLGPWHYINLRGGFSSKEVNNYLKTDTVTDAYTRLQFLMKELRSPGLAPDKKLFYLHMLVHIAGDLHQPLHVGHIDDQGGNAIKVDWFNKPTNLHSVWDEDLIGFQQLSYTEYANAINHATPLQRSMWQKAPVEEWIWESYVIADTLYREIEHYGPKLSYRYNFDHIRTVDEQLLKGGVRLAGILNKVFN